MRLLDRLLTPRRVTLAIVAASVALGGVALWSDLSRTLNQLIEPLRFGIVQRPASGRLAIVEMDAASTAAIKRWPWSRANYATVVDALRQAGATSIVFDVEFSTSSDAAGDATFAQALRRANGLVTLPTFGQEAGSGDTRTIDALPIPAFRDSVALASVSVAPGPDGLVRDMPFATVTDGLPRPSLSSFIGGRSGQAGETFPIDMSIDPATIPRLSFIAVRDHRFDPAAVRGRNVMIGATAIEMGDRYGTSAWGVIPGVVVQALAAETLIHGVPVRGSVAPIALLAALLAWFVAAAASGRSLALRAVAVNALLVGCVLAAQLELYRFYPAATGLIILAAATMMTIARLVLRQFHTMRLSDEATGLPNRRALTAGSSADATAVIAVVRIANYEDIIAVLGRMAETDMILRVADRTRLIAADAQVYRITDRNLALQLPRDCVVDEVMEGLRAVMLQPVEVAGRRIDTAVVIGVAEGDAGDLSHLLDEAARAAETADETGVFWKRAETDVVALERALTLMGELDAAIGAHELEVFYQPKLDLRSDTIVSAEALVRWPRPGGGFVPPDVFIPMAEQTDRIAAVTHYVLTRVLRDLAAMYDRGERLTVAVNISAKLLASAAFTNAVERQIADARVPATAIVFEVTESAAMANPDAAIAALERFRTLGIAVSMDDYGTGQSTLTYLRKLPLNELKIDRSFVQHAHRSQADALLVRSTIDLAHDMGLKVVAEGVEDEDCLTFLRGVGCDMVQGYFVSRPLPLHDFENLLTEWAAGRRGISSRQG